MQKHKKWFPLLIAVVNLVAAVMFLNMSWRFHRGWDTDGGLHEIKVEYKDGMLRVLHYNWMPVMALLTSVSGILLWRLTREARP